jgi:hypothetical protein
MASKEDDVRLPFSTLDPVVGDVITLLWEPEILTSIGQTVNLLATEVIPTLFLANSDPYPIIATITRSNCPYGSHVFHPMAEHADQIILSH